ncbi:MAG: hypothetical protein ACOZCL_05745 [Bacillota bacterium]
MDNFWSKLLILGIVAAIGVFFIGNVYNPQKTAQEAMADSTQQSVNSVKAGVEDTAPSIVKGDEVISTVNQYCKEGNTVEIYVSIGSNSYTFSSSINSDTGGLKITNVVDIAKYYVKKVEKSGTSIDFITFTQQ